MIHSVRFTSRSLVGRSRMRIGAGIGAAAVALSFAPAAFADDRYAAIVLDASTNEVLHADQPDAQRYPASLTKMMTLYVLFDELEQGRIRLSDRIVASRRAQAQPPSRLGIRAGDSISVEDAIEALVTRSANDVAVMVAERLDGSESRFASRMTQKARALGMRDTRYSNASGLPDPNQVTTARDVLTLSQALLRDHPNQYRYFQTASFSWRNVYSRNHNGLLGRVEGVDGIKTGYTRASGFNLASSAQRDGHRIFAVVLGGESAASRDAQMAYLIDNAFAQIDARTGGRPAPATAVYTSLPVTRVTVTIPNAGAPAALAAAGINTEEEEDGGGAHATPVVATVNVQQGSADAPSYVVPFPFMPSAPAAASAPVGGSVQIRGSSAPDANATTGGAGGN